MRISLLDSVPAECEELAATSPETTFYHTRLWLDAVAAAHARMSVACLAAEEDGRVRGYMPFFFVHTDPFRRAWSLPFGTYGGPVAGGDRDVQAALLERFRRLLEKRDIVEVGWTNYDDLEAPGSWTPMAQETHVVDLRPGYDAVFENQLARDRRQRSRRAVRLGVEVYPSHDRVELDKHYAIYHERMLGFKAPVIHPPVLFRKLFDDGGDRVRLFIARRGDDVVGAHFNFCHRGEMIAWFGMASALGDKLQAGTLLYTETMRAACAEGFERYNLGGSLGRASLVAYKESLGGLPRRYNILYRRGLVGRLGAAVRRIRGRS